MLNEAIVSRRQKEEEKKGKKTQAVAVLPAPTPRSILQHDELHPSNRPAVTQIAHTRRNIPQEADTATNCYVTSQSIQSLVPVFIITVWYTGIQGMNPVSHMMPLVTLRETGRMEKYCYYIYN